MRKLTKQQNLIILCITCCSIAFLFLLITNIHSIIDACKYLKQYNHLLNEPDLVDGLSKESIVETIKILKKGIIRISFSILSFSILFSTSLTLLIKKFVKSSAKHRIDKPIF